MYMTGAFQQSQVVGVGPNKEASALGGKEADLVQMASGPEDMKAEVGREGSVYHRGVGHMDPCMFGQGGVLN